MMSMNTSDLYSYNLRNSLNNEKLVHKLEPTDKVKLEGAVDNTIKWPDVSQDDLEEEKKLEAIANPFVQKPYGGASPGAEGGIPGDGLPLCAPASTSKDNGPLFRMVGTGFGKFVNTPPRGLFQR
jgi:L1 cell adhesion molecule like protein